MPMLPTEPSLEAAVSNYRVTLEGWLKPTSGELDSAEVRGALRNAMEELGRLGTRNVAITLNINDGGRLLIRCSVEVADSDEAVPPASRDIRSALHHAEIGTSEWPGNDDPRWKVEFFNTKSEVLVAA